MKFYGIDAEYQAEALKMARKLFPHAIGLVARRVTGDPGKSGMFQAYTPFDQGRGLNSLGDNFHVTHFMTCPHCGAELKAEEVAGLMRAIPSAKRSETSKANGAKSTGPKHPNGGRPKGAKDKQPRAPKKLTDAQADHLAHDLVDYLKGDPE